ncbi:nuclear transport factor 2 family protein [Catenulispora sp. NF23]|uniref:nuclear transport factor 2 family protein n=1 Tax=Catenulispora pinistramenti TaxID=2705254 RepID=UPI001BA4EA9E|nr:nuclear transport factor 2 family protein [Catenulispora pinistramenti]MBS2537564.1 nuclear transport factor 2 family protein [Catenulispora pinistramenti]
MSEHVRTTRETIENMLRVVIEGTRDDLADCYAEDVVITNPFAPEEFRESRGNAAVRTRMKSFAQYLHYTEIKNVTIHETTDPQVAVVEFTVVGDLAPSGKQFELPSINVIRVVDGLIAESRDHSDGVRTAKLLEDIQAQG